MIWCIMQNRQNDLHMLMWHTCLCDTCIVIPALLCQYVSGALCKPSRGRAHYAYHHNIMSWASHVREGHVVHKSTTYIMLKLMANHRCQGLSSESSLVLLYHVSWLILLLLLILHTTTSDYYLTTTTSTTTTTTTTTTTIILLTHYYYYYCYHAGSPKLES